MRRNRKGVRGRLITDYTPNFDVIRENIQVFNANCDVDFNKCEYDIYVAEYKNKDILCIDYNLLEDTQREALESLKKFKKNINEILGVKVTENQRAIYDKVF